MSKTRELVKNTVIIAIGKFATQLLALLLLPIYTFFLTPDEFGKVDLIIVYSALLAPLITLQVERAAFRYLIDARGDHNESSKIITNSFALIILGGTTAIASLLVINNFYSIPFFWLALGVFLTTTCLNLMQQVARGLGNNRAFSIGSVITGVFQIIASLLFVVFLKLGASGILAAIITANTAGVLFFIASLKLWRHLSIGLFNLEHLKLQLGYSIPLVPSNIAWWVITVSDRIIITLILGVWANGIYALAVRLSSVFSAIYTVYDMSWTESVSMHINAKDKDAFISKAMNQSLRLFGAIGLLLIAFVGVIFNFIVDTSFDEAYNYVPILILGGLFNATVAQYSAVYIAKKQTKKVAASSIGSAILNFVLTTAGIYFIGIYAAALATVAAFFAMTVYRHFETRKYVTIIYDKQIIVLLTASYFMVFVMYYQEALLVKSVALIFAFTLALFMNRRIIDKIIHLVLSKFTTRRRRLWQ